jgi:hypothetical protein
MSKEVMKRIASELRYYNPLADKYKGEFIHKVWAAEIEEALAKQEQSVSVGEPVAKYIGEDWAGSLVSLYEEIPLGTLLYTTPQQRKPLTDEQIDKAWRSVDYTVPWEQHRIDIARAIEAAHGIKEKNT